MGFFPREAAAVPETFTGERLTASITGQVEIEHYHRYLFARAFCLDRDVLDIASGEGYGSAQIAQVARSVVGVEYSGDTVRHARGNFPRANLGWVRADARAVPLRDHCVDVAVSFETIEHFDRQEQFVAEIRRVLRPDGCFIVSTPERDIYSPTGAPTNSFHIRELGRREFEALLGRYFRHCRSALQRPLLGSAILGESGSANPPLIFERRGPDRFEACAGLARAPYIVSIASDQPIPDVPHSLFIEQSDLDIARRIASELDGRTTALALSQEATRVHEAALAVRTEQLAVTEAKTDQREIEVQRQFAAADRERMRLEARIADLHRELDHVTGSARTFLRRYLPRLWRHLFRR